jgi:isopentenyl diphosphate isomerase/L-lactate dehydrogenase-like FMN-dependent dehydrogenase
MKVSVAVAMALNPNLKVVLVRDGSLLDKKSLAALAEAAAEKGFDVLLETVDTTTPGGFEIVDGANADAPAPTPTKKEKRS